MNDGEREPLLGWASFTGRAVYAGQNPIQLNSVQNPRSIENENYVENRQAEESHLPPPYEP